LSKKRRKASNTPPVDVDEPGNTDKNDADASKAADKPKVDGDVPTTPSDNVSDYNNMSVDEQVFSYMRLSLRT